MASTFGRIPALSSSGSRTHVDEFTHARLALLLRVIRECGPVARLRFRGREVVVVSSPEIAHEVLVANARSFDKSPGTRLALYPLAGEGLFTARGDLWRRQRRVMAPLFSPSEVGGFAACMVEAANRSAGRWREGQTIELARATTQIAMAIVGRALFDAETFDEADDLGEALTVALAWANALVGTWPMFLQLSARRVLATARDRFASTPLRPLLDRTLEALEMPMLYYMPGQHPIRKAVATIDRRVDRMIAARRESGRERNDLVAQLLRAKDDETSGGMSEKQVRDEAVTLFIAGHETTALGLAWAFHELAKEPALYAAVQSEGDRLAGWSPASSGLPSLPRSLAVFKEALRMYPPVYLVLREAREDAVVGSYALPRGTIVMVSVYGIHHNPDVYGDPERFDPNRFEPQAEAARSRGAWLPFGAGPRVCIGNHFALLEGQLVLASLARQVGFAPAGPVHPAPSATLRPSNGMPVIVRRREAGATGLAQ
jgi:cytochrome P450